MHWQQLHCVTIAQGQHFDRNDVDRDDDDDGGVDDGGDGGGVDDDDDDGGGGDDDDNGDSTILYLPMVHDIVFLVVHNIVFTGPNVVLYLLEGLTNRSHYCSDFALSYHFKYFQ